MVVFDSEYIFKGISIRSGKWRRHGWKTSSGRWGAGTCSRDLLQLRWVPSHRNSEGNEAADALAGRGREQHPNHLLPSSKRPRVTEWDTLGLESMMETDDLRVRSDADSGGSGLIQQHSKSRR